MRAGTLCCLLLLNVTGACGQGNQPAVAEEPLATVGGQPVYEKDLLPLTEPQLRQLRKQEYEIRSRALESLIQERLVEAEAKKKGVTPEKLLEEALGDAFAEPTDAEIEAFYLAQRDRIQRPLADVKGPIRDALRDARRQSARQAYVDRLRAAAKVEVYLRPPRVEVAADPSRLRGDPAAPVTIVEFSDFQCPFCARVQPTLQQVLEKYQGRVNLSYRDFPLSTIHPNATKAGEAARCAGEQGKFWEYHDRLFADISKLDPKSLAEHARSLGLDGGKFDACLESGKFRPLVERDQQEGAQAGVTGTPGFFINGVALSGAQPAAEFERIIEAELAAQR
jgi:protein-disulfide isomerase